MLWHEIHANRGEGLIRRWVDRLFHLGWLAALGLVVWWFARPAFTELAERGYRASPEAFALPEMHPLIRLIVRLRISTFAADASPGQARLELNVVLRLATVLSMMMFAAMNASMGVESIRGERRRETWLGLIATPLSAREILRGKALGSIWKTGHAGLTLITLWTVGLVTGAVHPLGFLGSLALLAILAALYPAVGLRIALAESNAENQGRTSISMNFVPIFLAWSFLLIVGPIGLAWLAPLTYEDLAAAIKGAPFPELHEAPLADWIGARAVVLTWIFGTAAFGYGAFYLSRSNERGFDAAVGRPVRNNRQAPTDVPPGPPVV